MPIKSDDLQVIISYKQLTELLNASQKVDDLERKVDRTLEKMDGLRSQFSELMDAFKQLM